MLYAKITGIASYVPDDILDNEQLSQMVDTTDEWITTRVGIKERRILKQNVGSSFLGIKAVKMDGQPHGSGKSDQVAMAAERRDRLLNKIQLVDDCAREIGGGEWYAAIIQNVCIGRPYEQMDRALMPTSEKNAFFKIRRMFFDMLNKMYE